MTTGVDVLSPAEQILWECYYCLEPFDGHTRYLAYIEAAIRKAQKAILPPECNYDQPLEDLDVYQSQAAAVSVLDGMVAALFEEAGLDYKAELARVGREAEANKQTGG